jgi:hypothetical protein
MRLKASGKLQRLRGFRVHSYSIATRDILRVRKVALLNLRSARSFLSTLLLYEVRALLRPSFVKIGGIGINDSEDRRIFSDLSQFQLNKSTDFTSEQVGRVHNRRYAENLMVLALSGQWPFGKLKLDLIQSSLRRVRSSNLKLASWLAELVEDPRSISELPGKFRNF